MFEKLKYFSTIFFGTFIIAVGVYFFMNPNHIVSGSISGLAVVLVNFVPLSLSAMTLLLNIICIILAFLFVDKTFGTKIIFISVLLPALLFVFELLFPGPVSPTGNIALDMIAMIIVICYGQAVLFNANAASGGLDIIAKIMNKYLHMELGKAMSLSGMCVALSAALVYDKKTVVLSILGTYFNGIILDHFIFNNNIKRRVCIITKKEEELREFIINNLHSGATIYEAIGAYNFEKHNEIITIVDKREYQALMNYISSSDPEAFITVYKVSDIRYRPKKFSA